MAPEKFPFKPPEIMRVAEDSQKQTAPQNTKSVSDSAARRNTRVATKRVLASELPQNADKTALSLLFRQYRGFQSLCMRKSEDASLAEQNLLEAVIEFSTPREAQAALRGLQSFQLTPTDNLQLSFT